MLRYIVEDGESRGIVLGLLEANGSTRILAYGDGGSGARPLGPASVFEIGSVTKTFTGTLLADMVARGEVGLEDPVSSYLPDGVRVPSFEGREISLLDLATHTSGLPGAPGHIPADPTDPWADWTVDELYGWLSGYQLQREPGTVYEYSNVGMGLLGRALARRAGKTFPDLVEERILQPLGMELSGYEVGGDIGQWMVQGYQGPDPVPPWSGSEAIAGAGGLRSNLQDMLKYLAANVASDGSELGEAMRMAWEPRRPTGQGGEQVGLGWNVSRVNGRTMVRKTGGTGGFHAEVVFDPDRRIGAVILANAANYAEGLGQDLVMGGSLPDYPEVALAPEVLGAFPGEYQSSGGLPLYVQLDGEGYLTGQAPGQIQFRLYPTSDSTFYAKRVPFTVLFHRNAGGEAEDLVLGIGGRTNRFERTGDDVPSPLVIAGNFIASVSAEEIAVYQGTYAVEVGGQTEELRVYGVEGRLMGEFAGGRLLSRLAPKGEHEFVAFNDQTIRVQFTVEDGRAVGITIFQNGETYAGKKRQYD